MTELMKLAEECGLMNESMRDYYKDELIAFAAALTAEKDARIAELESWKAEACEVFNKLDLQAIGKALNLLPGDDIAVKTLSAINALRAELDAARAQEPAAWMHPISKAVVRAEQKISGVTLDDLSIPLYSTPVPATAVPAPAPTAEQVREACAKVCADIAANWISTRAAECEAEILALDLTKIGGAA